MYLLHCILSSIGILSLVKGTTGQTPACGGILTSQAGTIMSPNFPSNYPDLVTCTWTITVAQNQVIAVRFHRFDVDLSDRVTFYDGNTTSRPVLKGYLGGYWDDTKMATFRIRTTGPSLLIVFNAWGPPSGLGFSASYWAHECPPFTYGLDYCNNTCSCQENNTRVCNSTSGQCECQSGWQSTRCDVIFDACGQGYQCSDLYENCASRSGVMQCSCREGLVFNQSTKRCESTCTTQQSSCSHACGLVSTNPHKEQCYCPHGMKLDPANNRSCVECTGWFYGEDCKSLSTCNRQHTQEINKINGSCICYSNWSNSDCSSDFDECSSNPSNYCNLTSSRCSNAYGDYTCPCVAGYEEISTKICNECGKIFTNSTGTIYSPFYSHYKSYVEVCSWTIAVTPGSVIDLRFNSISLHNGIQQNPDSVNIFDGANVSAPLLGSFDGLTYHDGHLPPGYVRSSGNTMHIVRFSGQSSSYGFTASYTSHECKDYFYGPTCSTSCNCNRNNTKYCNSLTGQCICRPEWTSYDCSADKDECLVYPSVCPNYSDCTNLQPGYDCSCKTGLVKNTQWQCVYSSDSTSGCSLSCGGMCVHMKATGVEHCYCPVGSRLVGDSCVNCSYGTFGPDCSFHCSCVENNTASCNAVTGQCVCKPGWTSESCSQDIDECYFETYTCPQQSVCLNRPGDYKCVCERNNGVENADDKTCRKRECHFILTSPSGNITSPDYPDVYYNYANCTWEITAEQGKVISVRIDTFATELNYDYLTFYNGNNMNGQIIGRYHGNSIPRIIRSVGNTLFISFTSDSSNVGKGLQATYYSHYCQDFMFGDTCTEQCHCNRSNTEYCDNIQGECLCKLGWKGYTCIDDVSECLGINNFLCPRDSDCRNTDGNYTCICHQGFLKNTSTNLCDPIISATTTSQPAISQPTVSQPTVDGNVNGNVHQDYICHFGYMDVHIPVSLVPDSKLRLEDETCQLVNNGTHHVINVPYDDCGTDVHNFRNYTLMTNKITVHTDLDVGGGIVFGEDYTIDLSCTIPKHQSVDGTFQAVTAQAVLETSENTSMGYLLKEYETADYTKEITQYPVQIPSNKNIFFEVSLKPQDRINSTYGIQVDECRAMPSLDPNNANHFVMIKNGCPTVPDVHMLTSPGLDVFRFYIHSFHFPGPANRDNYVYVHCVVTACPKTSCPNGCSAAGGRRRRRNASPLVTLSIGPYIIVNDVLH